MSYKYIGEDEQYYKVLQKNGEELHIAKNSIGPQVEKRIKSLEPVKMADGGFVPDESYSNQEKNDEDNANLGRNPYELPEKYNKMQVKEEPKSLFETLGFGGYKADPYGLDQQAAPVQQPVVGPSPAGQAVQMPQPEAVPLQAQQPMGPMTRQDAFAAQAPLQDYAQAFAAKEAGITQSANAQARAGQEQANAYEQQAKQLADIQKNYQEQHAKLDAEHKQLIDATLNDKIDPNRLYNNMSTGNKILAAISVALSGIGSGLAGRAGEPNQAMAIIQKSIERDIEAQRAELGKKQTLLSENLRRYGDLNTATEATRLQLNAITQAKVSQSAALANTNMAKAQALALNGDLSLQAADLKSKISDKQALSNMVSGGNVNDAQVQQLPKEIRERAVKIGGKYALALDDQSAKEARKIVGANDALIGGLDKLVALRQKYGAETIPGPVKSEMQTIATSLQLAIKEAKQLGTLDKGAEKFMEKLVADPTSIGFVADQYKALKAQQMAETAQRLKPLGISYSGQEQQPQYKTVNGIKYMRGPNGEAIQVK